MDRLLLLDAGREHGGEGSGCDLQGFGATSRGRW